MKMKTLSIEISELKVILRNRILEFNNMFTSEEIEMLTLRILNQTINELLEEMGLIVSSSLPPCIRLINLAREFKDNFYQLLLGLDYFSIGSIYIETVIENNRLLIYTEFED